MLALLLGLYFSFTLLTASLAKLDNTDYFAATLRVSQLIPVKIVPPATKIIPLGELVFAFLIIFQEVTMVAAANLVLFIFFLGYKINIAYRKLPNDCGCFGQNYKHKIDGVSITVSTIQVGLAALYLWLVTRTEPVDSILRFVLVIVFLGFSCIVLWRIQQRRKPKLRTI